MQCTDKKEIIDYIENHLSEKRRIHTYAVVKEAKSLAKKYGIDVDKAELAALFHDFFRSVKETTLNGYVIQLGLDSHYLNNSNLAHSKIAAAVMERDYGIDDQDILNAVSYHTTGRAGMSGLEKVIYIADAIEPNRSYPGVLEIREQAYVNLNKACLISIEHSISFVESKGLYLDKDTLMARDSIKKEIERGEII